jgi:oxygen-independent coproporphyrinogen-3 oxidase
MSARGLYLHIPFCRTRCAYCAFVSVAGQPSWWDPYLRALTGEMALLRQQFGPLGLGTVYVGGGTPSVLGPARLSALLDAVRQHFVVEARAEVTVEVNPGTVDRESLAALRAAGYNRLSVGVQSFDDGELAMLGRTHTARQATAACVEARQAGFGDLSIDLIFSVPGASAASWQGSLNQALALAPEHLSAYGLTWEEGTDLVARAQRHEVVAVDEDLDADLFALTHAALTLAGYEHYEVSNYARPGRRCRHNWGYWSGVDYVGVGVAAHSFYGGRRWWNMDDIPGYIECLTRGESPATGGEQLDAESARRERLWLSLRTADGVPLRAGEGSGLARSSRLGAWIDAGWVCLTTERLALTGAGLALADSLAGELVELLSGPGPDGPRSCAVGPTQARRAASEAKCRV